MEQRRDKVKKLYFELNYTIREVAQALEWDDETIWRDIKVIRDRLTTQIKEAGDDPLIKMIQRKEAIIQEAYNKSQQARTELDQRAWLNISQKADSELFVILIKTGIIREAPKEVINYDVPPDRLERYRQIAAESKNKRTK